MTHELIYTLVTIVVVAVVSFRAGSRYRAGLDEAQYGGVIAEIRNTQKELNEAGNDLLGTYAEHAASALTILDQYIAETGKAIDPDHRLVIDEMRPYYEMKTLH